MAQLASKLTIIQERDVGSEGQCGTLWDAVGRCGTLWDGVGRWNQNQDIGAGTQLLFNAAIEMAE